MKFTLWVSVALTVVLGATVRIDQARLGAERARGAQVAQVTQQRDGLDKAVGDARLDSTNLALNVALDPIQVEARVTCAAPDSTGVRVASVVARGPAWATLNFGRVEQSPELCQKPARARRFLEFEPLVIGGGRLITPDGRGAWGFFAGSGVRVWI